MSWNLEFDEQSQKDINRIKKKYTMLVPRLKTILNDLKQDPYSFSFKGERLKKHGHSPEIDLRSKRLDKKIELFTRL